MELGGRLVMSNQFCSGAVGRMGRKRKGRGRGEGHDGEDDNNKIRAQRVHKTAAIHC
jgi:hypothetical protein